MAVNGVWMGRVGFWARYSYCVRSCGIGGDRRSTGWSWWRISTEGVALFGFNFIGVFGEKPTLWRSFSCGSEEN